METIKLSPFLKMLLFLALSLATFMIVLDYSIANVSIPYIAGDLSVSVDQGTYVITSFAVGNAIGLAMTGWLTRRFGIVYLLCASLLLFSFFSWVCGASLNLEMLVINRFIQGFVAGPMIPLSQSLILQTSTKGNQSRDLSIWSMIVVTAPVLGPILGGYISEWHRWTWIFYINVPIGTFCACVIWMILRHTQSPREKAPIDVSGFCYLVLGVSSLQILLDKGQQWDWLNSPVICGLIVISTISFTLLIIREVFHDNPFLKLRVFSSSLFSLSIICLSVSYAAYFGSFVLVPLWLQQYMGYDAVWAGISVSSIGIAPIFLSVLTPKLMKLVGNFNTLIVGFSFFTAACFYTAYFTPQIDVLHILGSRFFFGIGMVCYIIPLIAMSVEGIAPENLPNATSIFHFIRAMVGGIGTSVFTTLFQRKTIFHHERLAETLTPFSPLLQNVPKGQSLALLNGETDVQASMLAMNDAFFLMGWLFLGLIALLFLGNAVCKKQMKY